MTDRDELRLRGRMARSVLNLKWIQENVLKTAETLGRAVLREYIFMFPGSDRDFDGGSPPCGLGAFASSLVIPLLLKRKLTYTHEDAKRDRAFEQATHASGADSKG